MQLRRAPPSPRPSLPLLSHLPRHAGICRRAPVVEGSPPHLVAQGPVCERGCCQPALGIKWAGPRNDPTPTPGLSPPWLCQGSRGLTELLPSGSPQSRPQGAHADSTGHSRGHPRAGLGPWETSHHTHTPHPSSPCAQICPDPGMSCRMGPHPLLWPMSPQTWSGRLSTWAQPRARSLTRSWTRYWSVQCPPEGTCSFSR